jgi:hypothetical protein
MGGRNFMMGNYEYTPLYRAWDAVSVGGEHAWDRVLFRETEPSLRDTQGKIDKLAMARGLKFVKENPGLTLKRDIVKFFDFWGLERELVAGADRGYFGPISRMGVVVIGIIVCGYYVAVLFGGIFGAVLSPPTDRRQHVLLMLPIAFICGVHTLVFAHSRYHLPVMPFVTLYAAAALTGAGILANRRRAAFWLATGLCALVASGWAWNAAAGDLTKILRIVGLV